MSRARKVRPYASSDKVRLRRWTKPSATRDDGAKSIHFSLKVSGQSIKDSHGPNIDPPQLQSTPTITMPRINLEDVDFKDETGGLLPPSGSEDDSTIKNRAYVHTEYPDNTSNPPEKKKNATAYIERLAATLIVEMPKSPFDGPSYDGK